MPGSNQVLLTDPYALNPDRFGPSPGYQGHWVVTIAPFTVPVGTDGFAAEIDFVVADPDGNLAAFWMDPPAGSPASVFTAGFTFDSASPPAGWSFGVYISGGWDEPADNIEYWDGGFSEFDGGFAVTIDPGSNPSWYLPRPPGWVAVGIRGTGPHTLMVSQDAVDWRDVLCGFDPDGFGLRVKWNGTQWMAVGGTGPLGGMIITSPDALAWTTCVTPFDGGNPLDLDWNGSEWMVVGTDSLGASVVATTPDGGVWTTHATALTDTDAVAWGGTGLWLIGGAGAVGSPFLASSPDAVTWTLVPSAWDEAGSLGVIGITWANGTWVVCGKEGEYLTAIPGPANELTTADQFGTPPTPGRWTNSLSAPMAVSGGVLSMSGGLAPLFGATGVDLVLNVNDGSYPAGISDEAYFTIDAAVDNSTFATPVLQFRSATGTLLASRIGTTVELLAGVYTTIESDHPLIASEWAPPGTAYISLLLQLRRGAGDGGWTTSTLQFRNPILHRIQHPNTGLHVVQTSPDLAAWANLTTPMDSGPSWPDTLAGRTLAAGGMALWSQPHGLWIVAAATPPDSHSPVPDTALMTSPDLAAWTVAMTAISHEGVAVGQDDSGRIAVGHVYDGSQVSISDDGAVTFTEDANLPVLPFGFGFRALKKVPIPLRQRQRDDGLISTGRVSAGQNRARSLEGSLRQAVQNTYR